jgi:hypothetical protein
MERFKKLATAPPLNASRAAASAPARPSRNANSNRNSHGDRNPNNPLESKHLTFSNRNTLAFSDFRKLNFTPRGWNG